MYQTRSICCAVLLFYAGVSRLWAQSISVDSLASMGALLEATKYVHIEEYAKAEQHIKQSLEADPHNSAAYFLWARISRQRQRPQAALQQIDLAIELQQDNKSYYLEAVSIAKEQRYFSAAVHYYEQLLAHVPGTSVYYEPLAELYLQTGDHKSAIKACKQSIEEAGYTRRIGLCLQDVYLRQGDSLAAEQEAERLARRFPEDELQLGYAARMAARRGSSAAIEYLSSLLLDTPDRSTLRLQLGVYYLKTKAYAQASELLLQAFSDPLLPWAKKLEALTAEPLPQSFWASSDALFLRLLAVHLTSRDLRLQIAALYQRIGYATKALTLYRSVLEQGLIDLNLFETLISLELEAGVYDSAFHHIQRAETYYPLQPRLYLLKGQAYLATNELDAARASLEQGITICYDPELKSTLYLQMGHTYWQDQNIAAATKAYEAALDLQPQYPQALNSYSYMLARASERLERAKGYAKQLINLYPDIPTYLDTYASVLYAEGRYKKALKYLEQALSKEQTSDAYLDTRPRSEIIEHYGDTLYQLERIEEALRAWQRAQALPDASPLLERKIKDKKLYE